MWKAIAFLVCIFANIVSSKQPHIVFFLIDDLGWNDVSFHGSKQIPTPNIDALAYSGIILNNYYVQPLCTPSRGSLMTGKYPIRLGLQHNVIYAESPWGLSLNESILPEYLKRLGYATHGIGKWHLGFFRKEYLPTYRGFDSFMGYWTGKEDYYTHFEEGETASGLDFHENEENVWKHFGHYSTDVFTNKAVNIIKDHNPTKPLFLYVSHQAVHSGNQYDPLQAPPCYINKFSHIKDEKRKVFAAMAKSLDDSIGKTVAALEEAKLLNDTIIVFSTDNGGAVRDIDKSTGSNWPLRGSKYTLWEGGIRGAAFIWSIDLLNKKHKVLPHMMHISDWLPTLYLRAGGSIELLRDIDGFDLWPSICCNEPSPRNEILHNIDPVWQLEAIRKGKYKLLRGTVFNKEFDRWFDKEGIFQINIPFTEKDLKVQEKVYETLAKESEVSKILLRNYGDDPLSHYPKESIKLPGGYCSPEGKQCDVQPEKQNCLTDLKVVCGPKPQNASTNCQPTKNACLFDIESDPCEYNNRAHLEPTVVKHLEDLLNTYRAKAVPIRNKPGDPAGNPKQHGYVWIPWL